MVELGLTLNAREWAGLFWLGVLILWSLFHKDVRSSLANVFRTAMNWRIFVPLLCLFAWIALEVWLAAKASLWGLDFTKDTIIWVLSTGIASFFSFQRTAEPLFFRRAVIGAVGIAGFLEYLVNVSVFHLLVELFLQPIIALLAMTSVYAKVREDNHGVKKITDLLLAAISVTLLVHTGLDLHSHRQDIDWLVFGLEVFLPIWLTIGLLPYVYLFGLIANYEMAFMRMDLAVTNKRAPWWAKVALVSKLHFRSRDVRDAAKGGAYQIANASSFSHARQAATEFQESLLEEERMAIEEQDRLVRYTGSQETDADGRRLDRREFKETTKALQWFATCQMGWYHKRSRYPPDLLERFSDDFTDQGLPKPSGITMHVSGDGQSWYAWRRTVTGWYFAIGAAGPPPNQWTYDGPEPPQRFPGEDPAWGERPFSLDVSRNWN